MKKKIISLHFDLENLKRVLSHTGTILYVPGVLSLLSTIIAFYFKEIYAIIPFFFVGLLTCGLGFFLQRVFRTQTGPTLWDSMAIAALSWLLCPLISAYIFYWISILEVESGIKLSSVIALTNPMSAIFEGFSAFTSTGFTLVDKPSQYGNSTLWWRSVTQWIGGVGLVVFVLLVVNSSKNKFNLYYAESRTDGFSKNLKGSIKNIWITYIFLTFFSYFLFIMMGMPGWEAINHALSGISSGGFSIKDDSFTGYNSGIKIAGIIIMLISSINFAFHYQVFWKGNYQLIWQSLPHRLLFLFVLIGSCCLCLIAKSNPIHSSWLDVIFTWVSTLSTNGWTVIAFNEYSSSFKLFLILAMFVGGCSGSTSGGFKIQRLMNVFALVHIRLESILKTIKSDELRKKSENPYDSIQEPGLILPDKEQTRKLFTSAVLFFLWIFFLFFGAFILSIQLPEKNGLDILYTTLAAISNVGIANDIISISLSSFNLGFFSFLMWIGRLEIIPAVVLFLSFIERYYKPKI